MILSAGQVELMKRLYFVSLVWGRGVQVKRSID